MTSHSDLFSSCYRATPPGQDDLNAPDLIASAAPASKGAGPARNIRNNGDQKGSHQQSAIDARRKDALSDTSETLKRELSAFLREQLLGQLLSINSSDQAGNWAHRVMGAKNTLARYDAERVEQAFRPATFANDPIAAASIAREPDCAAGTESTSNQ